MSVLENSTYWLLTLSPFIFAGVGETIDDSKGYWQYLFLLFSIVSFLILVTNYGRYFYSKRYGIKGGKFIKGSFEVVKGKLVKGPLKEKDVNYFWKGMLFPGYLLRRILLPSSFNLWILSSLIMFVLFFLSLESTFRNVGDYDISTSIPATIGITVGVFIIFYLMAFNWTRNL